MNVWRLAGKSADVDSGEFDGAAPLRIEPGSAWLTTSGVHSPRLGSNLEQTADE